VDISHGETVEKELDALIVRRSRKGEATSDEREELWMESVRRHNVRRREENRRAPEEHRGPADRLPRGRGGKTMRGGSPVSGRNAAELRARGIAALLCGERPAVVARDLGVPEGTARSWKHRAKNRGIATPKKGDFGALLTKHLETLIRSLLAQSRELSSRWSEMGARELALAFGLLFDRAMRMLGLLVHAEGGGVRS
jgi:transposase